MIATLSKAVALLDSPARRRWLMLIVLALGAAILETSGTAIVFALINLIGDSSNISRVPLIGSQLALLLDRFGERTIILLCFAAAGYFAVKNAFLLYEIHYRERCAAETATATGGRLLQAYLRAPYSFYFRRNSAELIRNLESSVDSTFRTVLLSAAAGLSEILVMFGVLGVLVAAEPAVAAASVGVIGGIAAGIFFLLRQKILDWGARRVHAVAAAVKAVQQSLSSVKEIKILGREDFFLDRYIAVRSVRARIDRLYAVINAAPRLAMESIMVIGMTLVIALLLAGSERASEILPVIGLFAYAGFRVVPSANRILMHLNNIRFGKAAVDSVAEGFQVVSESPEQTAKPDLAALAFAHEVRLDAVSYRYPGTDRDAIVDSTLVVPKGSSIGIVGATGAGKSTLVDILLGLLPPTEGRLLVDGQDVSRDPRPWQSKIGYVPQSIYLTDDTIRANIAFGLPAAAIDEARLRRAAEMAQILDYVDSLPEKFDTVVGERGIRLSGGQRQRIGIARALYDEPELLVFDEATSSLDNETEADISRAIQRLAGIKTIVLIAHRFSSLHVCSTLVMMKDGRIVAEGSYARLFETCDDFRALAAQSSRAAGPESAP